MLNIRGGVIYISYLCKSTINNHTMTTTVQRIAAISLIFATAQALPALATDFKVGNLYYTTTSDTEVMVAPHIEDNSVMSDYQGDIVIPSTVDYDNRQYTVTQIGEYAFYNCADVTSIAIPSTIRSIGSMAFTNCSNITELNLPEGLECISSGALFGLPIRQLTIPASCTKLGISPDDNVTLTYPAQALQGLTQLQDISVADGNSQYATYDGILTNTDKTSIYWFPEARTGSFTTPTGFNTIENGAFHRTNLTSLTISKDVNNIHSTAFTLAGFESLTIADNEAELTISIYNWMSNNNNLGNGSLKNLYLGRDINGSFPTLTDINTFTTTIGSKCNILSTNTYKFISQIRTYTDEFKTDQSDQFVIHDGALYHIISKQLLLWPAMSSKQQPDIFSDCPAIADYAFYSCPNLTSIVLPQSVGAIGYKAFSQTNIEAIEFGDNISTLGDNVCEGCTGLKEIRIKSGNISDDGAQNAIPANAFKGCTSIENMYIGPRINYVGTTALSGANVDNIYMSATTPPQYASIAMGLNRSTATETNLYVPKGTLDDYKNYAGNRYFTKIYEYDMSGIDETVYSPTVDIMVTTYGIEISGVSTGQTIEVYTAGGLCIYNGTATSITLGKGNYVVRIGNMVQKVHI